MTVWAFPRSDLHTRPTETPPAEASMAARSPAPPAPITRTSCSKVSTSDVEDNLKEPSVLEDPHREHPHVEIREGDPKQAYPGPEHVPLVQSADAGVRPLTHRGLRELVASASHQVTKGVTAEGVAAEQNDVHEEDERADPDAEGDATGGVLEPERLPDVVRQDRQEEEAEVQEVAVDVLENQRESLLTTI